MSDVAPEVLTVATADLITALGKVCRLCESVDVLLDTTAVLLDASAHSNAPMWPLVSEVCVLDGHWRLTLVSF